MLPLKDNLPTTRFPIITIVLIVINLGVFAWELTLPTDRASNPTYFAAGVSKQDEAILQYGSIPYRLTHPGKDCGVTPRPGGPGPNEVVCQGTPGFERAQASGHLSLLAAAPWWLTIFTAMFLHVGWLHVGGNMLFLWIFGNNVEDAMGRGRFVLFYLLAGVVAAYAQSAIDVNGTAPEVGASGAIAGVLGGYILLHPRARVLTLIFVFLFVTLVEIPAVIMLGIWFVLQALPAVSQLGEVANGGFAYLAHIGGFLFGLAAIKLFVSRRRAAETGPPSPAY